MSQPSTFATRLAAVIVALSILLAFGTEPVSAQEVEFPNEGELPNETTTTIDTVQIDNVEIVALERGEGLRTIDVVVVVPEAPTGQAPTAEVRDQPPGTDVRVLELDTPPTFVLAIDSSGSMAGQRLVEAKSAATECIANIPSYAQVGLIAYADKPTTIVEPSFERSDALAVVEGLQAQGETATFDAVIAATTLVGNPTTTRESIDERAGRFIVLLSDGEDTVSLASAADAVTALDDSSFRLFALGVDPDGEFLPSLEALTAGETAELFTGTILDLGELCASVAERLNSRYRLAVEFAEPSIDEVEIVLGFGSSSATVVLPAAETPAEPASGDSAASSGGGTSGGGPSEDDDTSGDAAEEAEAAAPNPNGGGAATNPGPDEDVSVDLSLAVPTFDDSLTGTELVADPDDQASLRQLQLWGGAAAVVGAPLILLLLLAPQKRLRHGLRIRALPRRGVVAGLSAGMTRLLEANRLNSRIDRRLELASLSIRAGEFVVITALITLLPAAALALLGRAPAAIGVFVGVPLVAWIWIKRRGRNRSNMFQEQLGDTLMTMAGALRSGSSTRQALALVAVKAPSPSAEEFQRVVTEAKIGRDLVESLQDLADRMGSEDAHWMVEAIALNQELGGTLSTTLDSVAETIRARSQIRSQVKVLSAEGRLTATILLALPFAVGVFLQFINPGYLDTLFSTPSGNIILGIALGLMVAGAFWVSRLIKLEY